jgi:predicted ribosomally synthesized peptide with SipW-like signal peptide
MSSKRAGALRLLTSARTRAALSLGVVLAVGATGTFAYWTDSATIDGTTFTAGTIDLQVNGANPPAYTTLNLATMIPGNSMAGTLVVRNNGNVPLKYTATSTSAPAVLSGALVVKVTGDANTTGTAPSMTCGGAALAGAATALGGATAAPLLATGRKLLPGDSETICLQVTLPANADPSLQGKTSAVSFTFTGTSDLS